MIFIYKLKYFFRLILSVSLNLSYIRMSMVEYIHIIAIVIHMLA